MKTEKSNNPPKTKGRRSKKKVEDQIQNENTLEETSSGDFTDDIFAAVEKNTASLSKDYLDRLHPDELHEILDFIDEDEEKEKYDTIKEVLKEKVIEPIEKARIDERVWSYFYDKYIIRLVLFVWVALGLTVLKSFFSKKIPLGHVNTMNENVFVTIIGAVFIIILWRILYAFMESKPAKKAEGSTLVRKKLGLRLVTKNGTAPSFFRCFLRGLFKAFPFGFFTLLTIELSNSNRGVHDILFGTYVVRINSPKVTSADISEFIKKSYQS